MIKRKNILLTLPVSIFSSNLYTERFKLKKNTTPKHPTESVLIYNNGKNCECISKIENRNWVRRLHRSNNIKSYSIMVYIDGRTTFPKIVSDIDKIILDRLFEEYVDVLQS